MFYMVKVWKVLTTELGLMDYANQYCFESLSQLNEGQLRQIARNTANAEQMLHLSIVGFRRATVGIYAPEKPNQSTEYLYSENLAADNMFGMRQSVAPCPADYALHVVKQTPKLGNGRSLYFGVLQQTDVTLGSGERWKLTTAPVFQQILDYWFHFYYWRNLPAKLVVPHWGIGVADLERFQPGTLIVGGATIASRRGRAREVKQGVGINTYNATSEAIDYVTNSIDRIRYWMGLQTQFNPVSLKSYVNESIGKTGQAAAAVEQMTSHPEGDTDPEPKTPIPRWGIDPESIWNLACGTKLKLEGWQTKANDIKPYEYAPGQAYYTQKNLYDMERLLIEIRTKAIELNDYDFFNSKLMPPPMTPCN